MQARWNLLDAGDLSEAEIAALFRDARGFAKPVQNNQNLNLLSGKTVANLFFENSTRTRLSFEAAARRLGASVTNFSASGSSVQKGETLVDTARNIEAIGAHVFVIRHASSGSAASLAAAVKVPVINAGDGQHEHPTQGLLDAFTLEEKLGSLRGKRVLIIGDVAHSRVARSNLKILKTLGAKVAICGPATLLPPNPESLGVEVAYRPEELLPKTDAVMALRIQKERQDSLRIPSLGEYARFWGLTRERAAMLKKEAIVMHPGPMNRGVEIDPEVADGPRSVILQQTHNGVLIRMAVLARALGKGGAA